MIPTAEFTIIHCMYIDTYKKEKIIVQNPPELHHLLDGVPSVFTDPAPTTRVVRVDHNISCAKVVYKLVKELCPEVNVYFQWLV